MLRMLFFSRSPLRAALIPSVAVGLLGFAARAEANIAPDALVYFNVRSLGHPEDLCLTDIDDCHDMHMSTPEQGMLEFQIFIDPQQWIHGELPVPRFVGDFCWPDAWTVVDYRVCRNGEAMFEVGGPNPHHLVMGWGCDDIPDGPDGMFLAMTIVFDVRSYGKFEPAGDCTLVLGCSDPLYVIPAISFAEAGTECEYTQQPCNFHYHCWPRFTVEGLELTGIEGGNVSTTTEVGLYESCYCVGDEWAVHSDMPWITGHVEAADDPWEFFLFVDADLAEVAAGTYESELQVEWCESAARCLPVTVTVESAVAADETASGRSASVPLELRLESANPFSGPFVWTYDNPATAWVRCSVYDASGREIVCLLDGERPGGPQTITWSAIDASGDRVPPGVYVIRLEAGGAVRSGRAVVLR